MHFVSVRFASPILEWAIDRCLENTKENTEITLVGVAPDNCLLICTLVHDVAYYTKDFTPTTNAGNAAKLKISLIPQVKYLYNFTYCAHNLIDDNFKYSILQHLSTPV